jgi:hypothetical protein
LIAVYAPDSYKDVSKTSAQFVSFEWSFCWICQQNRKTDTNSHWHSYREMERVRWIKALVYTSNQAGLLINKNKNARVLCLSISA